MTRTVVSCMTIISVSSFNSSNHGSTYEVFAIFSPTPRSLILLFLNLVDCFEDLAMVLVRNGPIELLALL
jgi:hypothetical protein